MAGDNLKKVMQITWITLNRTQTIYDVCRDGMTWARAACILGVFNLCTTILILWVLHL